MKLIDLSTQTGLDDQAVFMLDAICEQLEFEYASYASVNPVTGDVHGYANYAPEWKLHYMQQGLHRFDPTLHQTARSIAPVDWDRLRGDTRFNQVFGVAHDFGVSSRGITVPVRGPYGECGLISVSRPCSDAEWLKFKSHIMGELQVAAVHMHDQIIRQGNLSKILYQPNLSGREIEVLQWVADGKSHQDIGDILSISHRTVEVHLRSGREKLGALTTAQAVGRAIGMGIITPR